MSTTTQNTNFQDILKSIEDFYTENAISVWCPVADVTLKFKPLSIQQLKQFIELQVSVEKDEFGVIPGLELIRKLNTLITDNCVDKTPDLLKILTVIDRDAILLQLRANTKNTVEIQNNNEVENINLSDIVSNVKSLKFTKALKSRKKTINIGSTSIELRLDLPSIDHDNTINEYFVTNIAKPQLQKGRKQVESNVEKLLSNVYLIELSKYISQITVSKDSSKSDIDFKNTDNITSNMQVLEKLPSVLLSEVSAYIKDVKKFRDSAISYTSSDGKQVTLDIDVAFFTGI